MQDILYNMSRELQTTAVVTVQYTAGSDHICKSAPKKLNLQWKCGGQHGVTMAV